MHLPENTQIVVYSYNEIPCNNRSDWIAATGKNVDESHSMLSEEIVCMISFALKFKSRQN